MEANLIKGLITRELPGLKCHLLETYENVHGEYLLELSITTQKIRKPVTARFLTVSR